MGGGVGVKMLSKKFPGGLVPAPGKLIFPLKSGPPGVPISSKRGGGV